MTGIFKDPHLKMRSFSETKKLIGNIVCHMVIVSSGLNCYWVMGSNHSEHADLFKKEPKKYAPQYVAFCGYPVSIDKLSPFDPLIYQIEDGHRKTLLRRSLLY
jgi:hypothetical protein